MNKLERVKKVIELCKEKGITAYEIGKNTKIASFTAHKILTGETKNPSDLTLDTIMEFIQRDNEKAQQVNESPENYASKTIDEALTDRVVQKLLPHLEKIETALASILMDNEEIKELLTETFNKKTS